MMKWIPVVLALLLTACGSSNSQKAYYQLPTLDSGNAVQQTAAQSGNLLPSNATPRSLWIERVGVADYLAGSGLVYQTNDVQYVIAANNLWASPLDQQLQQTLTSYLRRGLPGWIVTGQQPEAGSQDRLNVEVTGFHGRYDGNAVVSGYWTLNHDGQTTQRNFSFVLKQQADGYDALVRTLAAGWQQEANSIISKIR